MAEEESKTARKRSRRWDICLVAAMLAAGLLAALVIILSREGGSYAEVTYHGQIIARYDLAEDGEYLLGDGSNMLVIEDGCAYMKDANCPDKRCMVTGRIRYDGQTIVCLPNAITVTVRSSSRPSEIISE